MVEFIRVDPKSALCESSLHDLIALTQIDSVKIGLESGGWIAGGAIRALLCGQLLSDYFCSDKNHVPGDVDIFFAAALDANNAHKQLSLSKSRYTSRSFGGNATQISDQCALSKEQHRITVTVQYVDNQDFCTPEIENSLLRFDFVNCMIAFDGSSIIMPKNWQDLERSKLLQINNTHSPFLATRIKKYVKWRGYNGLTPESRDSFADWLVKSLDKSNFSGFNNQALRALETVKEIGHLMTAEELLLFIGKWSTVEKHKAYGHMFEEKIDWALSQIQKTSTDSCSNTAI